MQRTLSRTYLVFPNWKQLIVIPTFVYLKDRKGMLDRPLQGKLFRHGSPGHCLGLLHLRVNEITTGFWDSI